MRLGVEAPATTRIAQHLHVGQEVHLDGLHALAFAGRAASLTGVEREAAGAVAGDLRFRGVGEDPADVIPETDVRGRAGARRLADGRLVHFEHAVDVFDAAHGGDTRELGLFGARAAAWQ